MKEFFVRFFTSKILMWLDSVLLIGHLRSTVTDGITIGHPCCAQHDCPIPLPTVKHHYCPIHAHLSRQCAVTICSSNAEKGFRTCSLADHRALELYHYQQGKAMFQLKHRLERLNITQTHDSLSDKPVNVINSSRLDDEQNACPMDLQPMSEDMDTDIDGEETAQADAGEGTGVEDEDVIVDARGIVCDGKPEKGNRLVRARFGRRRTHNEQLCVASCGVILGRATFFGSEAPNGVRVSVISAFQL